MKRSQGFTVIEVIAVIVFISFATSLLLIQRNNIAATHRDDQRKAAINAMYYALEEVYYKQNKSYPTKLGATVIASIDPELFKDPAGRELGNKDSEYRYEGTNCSGESCKSYSLRADLEQEADFIKSSRNK